MTIGMLIESLVGKAGALQVLLHVYCLVGRAVLLACLSTVTMRGCVRRELWTVLKACPCKPCSIPFDGVPACRCALHGAGFASPLLLAAGPRAT